MVFAPGGGKGALVRAAVSRRGAYDACARAYTE